MQAHKEPPPLRGILCWLRPEGRSNQQPAHCQDAAARVPGCPRHRLRPREKGWNPGSLKALLSLSKQPALMHPPIGPGRRQTVGRTQSRDVPATPAVTPAQHRPISGRWGHRVRGRMLTQGSGADANFNCPYQKLFYLSKMPPSNWSNNLRHKTPKGELRCSRNENF